MKRLGEGACLFGPSDEDLVVEGNRTYRTPICRKSGAKEIAQTVSHYGLGRSPLRVNPGAEEVLYVVSGKGTCNIAGFPYDLEPGVGVYLPAGAPYSIDNHGAEKLVIVGVCCPEDDQARIVEGEIPIPKGEAPRRTVRERDRAAIPVADREFKLMVDQDLGCERITQFIGFIPPSRAPFHYHTYEEAIYIMEGSGIVHTDSESLDFGPGTSIYLPIGVRHCIENPGTSPIRLLGVFYPSGSPAAAHEK